MSRAIDAMRQLEALRTELVELAHRGVVTFGDAARWITIIDGALDALLRSKEEA